MSTNFYIKHIVRPYGEAQHVQHIGKRAVGWTFSFNAQDYTNLQAWRRRLDTLGQREVIEDEYGQQYTASAFWDAVYATKESFNGLKPQVSGDILDSEGYPSWSEHGFTFCNYEFS